MKQYVIVGGGVAATRAAERIREIHREDPITLLAEEERPFYMRPLLADFVAGRIDGDRLWRTFETAAESKRISVVAGQPVVAIDRPGQSVELANGEKVSYDALLVATGVKPRLPKIPGVELEGVTAFSTYAEAVKVSAWASDAKTAVVIGRGLQGVELTRALRLRGLAVTMLVPDESPWFPALFTVKGELVEQKLKQHGVDVIALDTAAELVAQGDRVAGVKTREGRELEADIVGFALDQRARTEFLVGSGISLADGVIADARLQTTDPKVYAAGDVAQIEHDGKRRPIGYGWLRALSHGDAAGRNLSGEAAEVEGGGESEAQALYGTSLLARWE